MSSNTWKPVWSRAYQIPPINFDQDILNSGSFKVVIAQGTVLNSLKRGSFAFAETICSAQMFYNIVLHCVTLYCP